MSTTIYAILIFLFSVLMATWSFGGLFIWMVLKESGELCPATKTKLLISGFICGPFVFIGCVIVAFALWIESLLFAIEGDKKFAQFLKWINKK
jgi:hypothetical protein